MLIFVFDCNHSRWLLVICVAASVSSRLKLSVSERGGARYYVVGEIATYIMRCLLGVLRWLSRQSPELLHGRNFCCVLQPARSHSLTTEVPLQILQFIQVVEDLAALQVETSTAGTQWGTGGMATKLTAARIACAAGCHMAICHSDKSFLISRIMAGEQLGTVFKPLSAKIRDRKRWILSGEVFSMLTLPTGTAAAVSQPCVQADPLCHLNLTATPVEVAIACASALTMSAMLQQRLTGTVLQFLREGRFR